MSSQDMLVLYKGSPEQKARDAETPEKVAAWVRQGKAWEDVVFAVYRAARQGTEIERISIRVGWVKGVDSLVTLVAYDGTNGLVGFHGAEGATTMWERLARRLLEDTMTWRPDEYRRD